MSTQKRKRSSHLKLVASWETLPKQPAMKKPCNLCGAAFKTRNRYRLFCAQCRQRSEVLRYADWLPSCKVA